MEPSLLPKKLKNSLLALAKDHEYWADNYLPLFMPTKTQSINPIKFLDKYRLAPFINLDTIQIDLRPNFNLATGTISFTLKNNSMLRVSFQVDLYQKPEPELRVQVFLRDLTKLN